MLIVRSIGIDTTSHAHTRARTRHIQVIREIRNSCKNYSSNEKPVILVYFLITASSAYHILPPPPTENSNFGSRICPQQCWKLGLTGAARVLVVLRRRLVLEVVQPSRTLSRFHPQRRALPLSTFCWLLSPLCGQSSPGRLFVKMPQYWVCL